MCVLAIHQNPPSQEKTPGGKFQLRLSFVFFNAMLHTVTPGLSTSYGATGTTVEKP